MKGRSISWLLLLALSAAGCPAEQGAGGPTAGPEQSDAGGWFKPRPEKTAPSAGPSDVAKVICFYRPNPFLSFDREGDPDSEGFTFTLYLISRDKSVGVLENGTLQVKLYRLERRKGAPPERSLVREWSAETDTLVQSKKPHRYFGMGYQPQFIWEKADNLPGQDIEVVAAFTARDGRTIQGQTKSLRVPAQRGSSP